MITLPDMQTVQGLVARVLIGEPSFRNSVDDWPIQRNCMMALAAVLYNRVNLIPAKYTQKDIANTTTTDYREILAASNQFDGFGKNSSGYTLAKEYSDRVNDRVKLANTGTPGQITETIKYALELARQLGEGKFDPNCDPFINIFKVGNDKTTGRCYWMKTKGASSPTKYARAIPMKDGGDLAGNTFYTCLVK
ncbi:MAG: hypothetical protein JWM59_26 [Verrucomicrobiales bacterium]|nr:hypothetical protein [Verrucomicrobiales bacterium]